jgi:hypothetical protein
MSSAGQRPAKAPRRGEVRVPVRKIVWVLNVLAVLVLLLLPQSAPRWVVLAVMVVLIVGAGVLVFVARLPGDGVVGKWEPEPERPSLLERIPRPIAAVLAVPACVPAVVLLGIIDSHQDQRLVLAGGIALSATVTALLVLRALGRLDA